MLLVSTMAHPGCAGGCGAQKLDARVNLGRLQSRNPDSVMDSLDDGDFRMSSKAHPTPPPPLLGRSLPPALPKHLQHACNLRRVDASP